MRTASPARRTVGPALRSWIVGAMLTAVFMLVANVISDNAMRHATGQSRLPLMFLPATAAIVGPGCSLLLFETLAYIGMRRCKYANLPRSSKQAV